MIRPSSQVHLEVLREKIKLAGAHRWALYAVTLLIWLSGAVWLFVHGVSGGENLSSESQDWSPRLMKIHGAAAMLFLLLAGSLYVHVRRGLALKRNLFLGFSMIGLVLFLAVTGWMLYYVGEDDWRKVASLAHWILGLALPMMLFIHIVMGRRSGKRSV